MRQHRTITSIALAGLVTLGLGPPAWAGDDNAASGNSGTSAGTEAGTGNISDEQLQRFTVALNDVRRIRMEYMPKLQQAGDKAEQDRLKQQGRQDMLQAIRDSGLEVKEYNRIGNRIGNDTELKQRVKKIMQKENS